MKTTSRLRFSFAAPLVALAIGAAGCSYNLPVDSNEKNPAVPKPVGVIQGTVNYAGPGPCFLNGQVEGVMVFLLFAYDNPPPPDGFATTALNFATIPGQNLFANYPVPAKGAGTAGNANEFCPDPSVITNASGNFTLTELDAGRYQVRAFYSMHGKFNPLFGYSNLPNSGDVIGGALANFNVPSQTSDQNFQSIEVGTVDSFGNLQIPADGFVVNNVAVLVGDVLESSRPYFYIDYAGSQSFEENQPITPDLTNFTASFTNSTATDGALGWVTFPQDLAVTVRSNAGCSPAPCDAFQYADATFPMIHLKYGFPGNSPSDPTQGADAFLAKSAKPSNPFAGDIAKPFYAIDDDDESGPAEAHTFALTRRVALDQDPADLVNFGKIGPAILHDNANIVLAEVADLFPQVILAKLADDPNSHGQLLQPPTPQSDPAVIIQAITTRDDPNGFNLQATTVGPFSFEGSIPATSPLYDASGDETQSDLTAILRTAALCVDPQSSDPRGILTTPYISDPNPQSVGNNIIDTNRALPGQATLVKGFEAGCLPPGYYEVNVVYDNNQAWTLPNTMGECSYDALGNPTGELCQTPPASFPASTYAKGFPYRPLLQSQEVIHTGPDGSALYWDTAKKFPHYQVVYVAPSLRCMHQPATGEKASYTFYDNTGTPWVNNATATDTASSGVCPAGTDCTGSNFLTDRMIPQCYLTHAQQAKGLTN